MIAEHPRPIETSGLPGITQRLNLGGIDLYVTLVEHEGSPVKVLLSSLMAGSDHALHMIAIAKTCNRMLDRGKPVEQIAEKLGALQEPRMSRLVVGHPRISSADTFAELVGAVLVDRYGRQEVTQ